MRVINCDVTFTKFLGVVQYSCGGLLAAFLAYSDDLLFYVNLRRVIEVVILVLKTRLDVIALKVEVYRVLFIFLPSVVSLSFTRFPKEEVLRKISKLYDFTLVHIIILKHESLLLLWD